jgi:hypothetical protein
MNKFITRRKAELIIALLFAAIILYVIYPVLFYSVPETWDKFLNTRTEFALLNNYLLPMSIGLFLSACLFLYPKNLSRGIEILVLVTYSILNIKLLSVPLFHLYDSFGSELIYSYAPGFSLMSLIIGTFLNAALIVYWMRKRSTNAPHENQEIPLEVESAARYG